jgi:hypothetical protein
MAFRKIEEIVFQGNPSGEAFGGYIYSMSVQMGYSNGPTRITLNIVNEDGIYTATDEHGVTIKSGFNGLLGTSAPYELKIGDLDVMFLYLVSYEIRTAVGQRILTLQLVDTSVLLDKVFVGLINRHVAAKDESPYGPPYGKEVTASVDLKMRCLKCDGTTETEIVTPGETLITGGEGAKYRPLKRTVDVVQSSGSAPKVGEAYVEPNNVTIFRQNGGLVILGKEGFVEQVCDIPEVDYNFDELLKGIAPKYIEIKEDALKNPSLTDRNNHYRQQYTGTLRDVLNAWCADFAFSFTWDLHSPVPRLVGIDLTKELTDDKNERYIDKIKKLVNSITSESQGDNLGTIVTNTNESGSLENTYKVGYLSQYLKPARAKETNRVYFRKKMFYNIPIEAITTPAERAYMPIKDFMVTCALAKYSQVMRRHYIYSAGMNNQWVRNALGVGKWKSLTGAERDIIVTNMEGNLIEMARKFGRKAGGFSMHVLEFNDDAAAEFEQWQSNIANNFIGKYYYAPVDQAEIDNKACETESEFVNETEVVGGGQVEQYDLNNHIDMGKLPYADIMKNPNSHQLQHVIPFIDIKRSDEAGYDPDYFVKADYGPKGAQPTYDWKSKRIHLFSKEAPWGTPQEAMEEWKEGIPIEDMGVMITPITGTIKLMLSQLIYEGAGLSPETGKFISGNDNLKLVIVPNGGGMRRVFKVGYGIQNETFLGGQSRKMYSPHYFNGAYLGNMLEKVFLSQGEKDETHNDEDCTDVCETSVVDYVCGHCNYDRAANKMYVGYPEWTGWQTDKEDPTKINPIGVKAEYVMLFSRHKVWQVSVGPGMQKVTLTPTIIFPVMQPYQGYAKSTSFKKITIKSQKRILGSALPKAEGSSTEIIEYDAGLKAGQTFGLVDTGKGENKHISYSWDTPNFYQNNSMGIKVVENLITNDADTVINLNDPDEQQQGIIQVVVPIGMGEDSDKWNVEGDESGKFKTITLEQYHDFLYEKFKYDSIGSSDISETFNFTLAGLDFKGVEGLKELLLPEKGLLNLGISVDDTGTVADISFGTRPPVYPKAQVYMKKIEPKLNIFGR